MALPSQQLVQHATHVSYHLGDMPNILDLFPSSLCCYPIISVGTLWSQSHICILSYLSHPSSGSPKQKWPGTWPLQAGETWRGIMLTFLVMTTASMSETHLCVPHTEVIVCGACACTHACTHARMHARMHVRTHTTNRWSRTFWNSLIE